MAVVKKKAVVLDLKCERCGYVWTARGEGLPKVCANRACKSPYWNRPRQKAAPRKK
jgi:hypothetical protein